MGRGPSIKTELKKLKKRIETEFTTRVKLYKKHPEVWIGERLADFAKKTGITDVTKILAIVGMTYIVKKTIETSEALSDQMQVIVRGAPLGLVGIAYSIIAESIVPQAKKVEVGPEWLEWIVSFVIAYLIVEHFGDIMRGVGSATSGIKDIVSGLLMGGVPAA
jgi:hypothetical protein